MEECSLDFIFLIRDIPVFLVGGGAGVSSSKYISVRSCCISMKGEDWTCLYHWHL